MKSAIGPVMILLLMSTPSFADMSVGSFSTACSSSAGTSASQICAAYVNGLAAGILVDQAARADGTQICLPEGISTEEIRETLKAYLAEPSIAQLPAGGFITAALQAAYGCRKVYSSEQQCGSHAHRTFR